LTTFPFLLTSLPAERPGIRATAAEASFALDATLASLDGSELRWLDEAPLDRAVEAVRRRAPGGDYSFHNQAARTLQAQLTDAGGSAWKARYGRLLLLALVARLPSLRPELHIPELAWAEIELCLKELLAAAVASDGVPAWDAGLFVKDVGAAQFQLLPYDGMVADWHAISPRYLSREAPWRDRAALTRYLGRDFSRPGAFMFGHEWRGYREKRRQHWGIRLARTAAIAAVNPRIRGALSSGWMNDPAVAALSPALGRKAAGFAAVGARAFPAPTDEIAVERALALSETRRRAYEAGTYRPRVHAMLIRRSDLLRWARRWWDNGANERSGSRPPS
jgi:hypothetical protein